MAKMINIWQYLEGENEVQACAESSSQLMEDEHIKRESLIQCALSSITTVALWQPVYLGYRVRGSSIPRTRWYVALGHVATVPLC